MHECRRTWNNNIHDNYSKCLIKNVVINYELLIIFSKSAAAIAAPAAAVPTPMGAECTGGSSSSYV